MLIYDTTFRFENTVWPAAVHEEGLLVDFRTPDEHGNLTFRPDRLEASGVPPYLLDGAHLSSPPGLVLLKS